ncbi:MAG: 2-oxoacid:acceptor oxidoreductase subunit alpha, partial [Candidatus Brocadiales bacterium]|nr:2-oxoacid:acceptor oxidoreductase subunit alpha [Candidatus Brocadiales bacterium]
TLGGEGRQRCLGDFCRVPNYIKVGILSLDFKIKIGGAAGQGMQTIGHTLSHVFTKGGYQAFLIQDYQSRIRGGHNTSTVRIRDGYVSAMTEGVDVLIALNKETIDLHREEVLQDGAIIYDGEKIKLTQQDACLINVPLDRLASEKGGNKIYSNSVAAGAALGLMRYDFNPLADMLKEMFIQKGEAAEDNVRAARAGYEFTANNFSRQFNRNLTPLNDRRRMLISGNEALALGALAAGCKFMSAYPMTPSTGITTYLAGKTREWGLIVEQAEDEIAAINMAIGASYAGVRSLTATSGGGFCLMVEGLGLAGMTETPIVIVEGQRPGPSTGLPTRTEQADLEFVLHAAHGEFPRAVLTPGTAEEAFYLMGKAFNLAEKYQTPVIVMSDQHLADSYWTIDNLDISRVTIDRGELLATKDLAKMDGYKRHAFTDSGISPRALPGEPGIVVVTDSDEHDEEGHLTEDLDIRRRMVRKRMKKLEELGAEIAPPRTYSTEGAKTLLIGWGSTYGALKEAVDMLNADGASTGMMHISELWPFPAEPVTKALERAEKCFVVENNATGQLARIIRTETGKKVTGNILKFDGLPFSPEYIIAGLK